MWSLVFSTVTTSVDAIVTWSERRVEGDVSMIDTSKLGYVEWRFDLKKALKKCRKEALKYNVVVAFVCVCTCCGMQENIHWGIIVRDDGWSVFFYLAREEEREREECGSSDGCGCVLLVCDAEKLRSYFGAYGTVTDAVVMKDPISRRSRGFGFITYADPVCVDRALAQPNHILDSRRVRSYAAGRY